MSTLRESVQSILDFYLRDEERDFKSLSHEHNKKLRKVWTENHIVHDLRRLKHALDTNEIKES